MTTPFIRSSTELVGGWHEFDVIDPRTKLAVQFHVSVPGYCLNKLIPTFELDIALQRCPVGARVTLEKQPWAKTPWHTARMMLNDLLFEQVKLYGIEKCPQCGLRWCWSKDPHPAHQWPGKRHDVLCEACRLEKIYKEYAAEVAKEAKLEKIEDAKQRKAGFTHKTEAWIHPKKGGDDYRVNWYSRGEMSEQEIKALLRKKGSAVVDDWKQFKLLAP